MKKFGFTLTEVLMTLGIIGVVAALTTPALVKNTGTAQIGPKLAKFVNVFETGARNYMTDNGTFRLTQTIDRNNVASIPEVLSRYIIMSRVPARVSSAYSISPALNGESLSNMYRLNDGGILIFLDHIWGPNTRPFEPYKGLIGSVLYDINGTSGNNRAGKEVFAFWLDDTGLLVPYGSDVQARFSQRLNDCDILSDNAYNGLACTGRIAEDGWVVNY